MGASFRMASGASPVEYVKEMTEALKPTVDDVRYVAELHKGRIIARTSRGLDGNGQPFKEYTDAYAKRKANSGRDSGRVDLTWSGRMLKALMIHRITNRDYVIGVYGEEGIRAAAHNYGSGKMPKREFVTLSPEDERLLADAVRRRMRARVTGTMPNAA